MKEIPLLGENLQQSFADYEKQFKALADKKRLHILYELCQRSQICVCDMTDLLHMSQSKLSYHLKILLDADLISKTTSGTWSYYALKDEEIRKLLSEQLCCIFIPPNGNEAKSLMVEKE
jgi:ArsR family transcriptional regulator